MLANLGDFPYVFRSVYLHTSCPKLQTETFTECTKMTSVYLSSGLVNNKGADQPSHSHSLISAFVFRSFESIISRPSVAKETGLSLALSKTKKTGLFCVKAQIHHSGSLLLFLFTTAFFLFFFLDVLGNS